MQPQQQPYIVYYGIGLRTRQAFGILDPESHISENEDAKDILDRLYYLVDLENLFTSKGFDGDIYYYGNNLPVTADNMNEISFIYGYEIAKFTIKTESEFANPSEAITANLIKFKNMYHLDLDPKFYCIYTGNY